jgi:uncharacterized membrane protein YjgN (DUF898 family)
MDQFVAQTAPSIPEAHALRYDGKTGEIFRIWLLNIILNICTLGIYSFWGRTRMRVYVTSRFSLKGDAFEYSGLGKELFLGFLLTLPFFIGIFALSTYTQQTLTNFWDDLLLGFSIYFLFNVAIYASLRYRLSRTRWRGIRGRLTGSAWGYGAQAIVCAFVNVISLGLAIPYTDTHLTHYLMKNVWLGDKQGRFNHMADPPMGTHIVTLLLVPFTLGLSRFWYMAAMERYRYNNFSVGGVNLRCNYTGGTLLKLNLVNILILIVTLGWGMAFVIQRIARVFAESIMFVGDIETAAAAVGQSSEALGSSGEGLAGVFDADVGIA